MTAPPRPPRPALPAQVEEGTPFARWYPPGTSPLLPPEGEAAAMFELASSTLAAAGYEHYEVGGVPPGGGGEGDSQQSPQNLAACASCDIWLSG
jgi:hypothetical protein